MGALFGKLDDFEVISWLCGGCAALSAVFLFCLLIGSIAYGILRDRRHRQSD